MFAVSIRIFPFVGNYNILIERLSSFVPTDNKPIERKKVEIYEKMEDYQINHFGIDHSGNFSHFC
jgi:hypothetical protein